MWRFLPFSPPLVLLLLVVHLHIPALFAANIPRAACTTDAVLKALKSNSVSASPFCSSYVHVPVFTTFKSVAGVTATTSTETITYTSTVIPNFPDPLPTYVSQYAPPQVSSACSCLSVKKSTQIITASYSTVYYDISTTATTTATGVCATGTIYPGAHALSGQFSDATAFSLSTSSAYQCCQICNSGYQGPYASCVAWAYLGNGNCTSVLEGAPFADYMQPQCTHDGLKPGTIFVDRAKFPADVGGKGQCASTITVVNG